MLFEAGLHSTLLRKFALGLVDSRNTSSLSVAEATFCGSTFVSFFLSVWALLLIPESIASKTRSV